MNGNKLCGGNWNAYCLILYYAPQIPPIAKVESVQANDKACVPTQIPCALPHPLSDDQKFGSHRLDPRLLTATAFYLKLKLLSTTLHVDNTLTLVYLPRINACPLEVNGSTIRSDSPAYVTLYRLVNAGVDDAVFGSMERIRVGDGARFEVYIREERLIKGVFRRLKNGEGWRVDCTCVLEGEVDGLAVEEVEVCVAAEGVRMRERVVVTERVRRRRRHGALEEIPEEEEEEGNGAWGDEISTCSSSCECGCESGSDGGEEVDEDRMVVEMEEEMEGVRWAVDVGIWVVCLGVGYLVSRASAKTLRRRRILYTIVHKFSHNASRDATCSEACDVLTLPPSDARSHASRDDVCRGSRDADFSLSRDPILLVSIQSGARRSLVLLFFLHKDRIRSSYGNV
ncbi:uncharacterized protein [Phyllobates terribilis]|uniref:uncharacterized protein n=1 Tax=Phyllobates terribilis TaxID=111132 RepID=UPI003CCAC720